MDVKGYVEQEFGSLLSQVKDKELVNKALAVIEELMKEGNAGKGWESWDMPFTLNMKFDPKYTLAHHTYWVTKIALDSAKNFEEAMGIPVDYDALLVGGVLHDVAKLAETEEQGGNYNKDTDNFKQFRHPAYGAMIAKKHGLPDSICHIILAHAKEGDALYRSVEAQILHRADFIYYGGLRSHLGLQ